MIKDISHFTKKEKKNVSPTLVSGLGPTFKRIGILVIVGPKKNATVTITASIQKPF